MDSGHQGYAHGHSHRHSYLHTFGAEMKWHPHIHPVEFPKGNPIQQGEPGRHRGREGVVIPGTYKDIHGELVKIDPTTYPGGGMIPKSLIRIQRLCVFDHYYLAQTPGPDLACQDAVMESGAFISHEDS